MSAADQLDRPLFDDVEDDDNPMRLAAGLVWAVLFEAMFVAAVVAGVVLWRWVR